MKNIPKLRKGDILYSLNLILGLIESKESNPAYKGKFKSAPINVKVGFLGLRVLITCYEEYLAGEWQRIARTIRCYGAKNETNVALWKLLDYISVHRTPLYNLLLPFIRTREQVSPSPAQGGQLTKPMQDLRQSRAKLLNSLQAEIEDLRQEILKKKSDNLLDVNPARKGQRTSFVEYVSEVYNRHAGPHSSTSTLCSGPKDINRGETTIWRSVRPASSGSRYKYTGFRRKGDGRRTSYAGQTDLHKNSEAKMSVTSTSEPRLFRKGTVLRNRNRHSNAAVCENPSGEAVVDASSSAKNSSQEELSSEDGISRRLQRMKAQSRKTFKFKSRKKMIEDNLDVEELGDQTRSSENVSKAETEINTVPEDHPQRSVKHTFKPISVTSAVIRRQNKNHPPAHDICVDEDSISSTRTSSTVGYRDSFGENDDSCFDLLERYDNSAAVLKLLQKRRREGSIPEDSVQEDEFEPGYLGLNEGRDENTLI